MNGDRVSAPGQFTVPAGVESRVALLGAGSQQLLVSISAASMDRFAADLAAAESTFGSLSVSP